MNERPTLLAVFAHPDDEACGPGGTLARCAAEAMEVHLLCVTRGELGGAPEEDKRADYGLAHLRSQELRAACRALGVSTCTILDYPDGSLIQSDLRSLRARIRGFVRRLNPAVVIASDIGEPEAGDHSTVAVTTAAACLSPETGEQIELLLYFHSRPLTAELVAAHRFVRVDVSSYGRQKAEVSADRLKRPGRDRSKPAT